MGCGSSSSGGSNKVAVDPAAEKNVSAVPAAQTQVDDDGKQFLKKGDGLRADQAGGTNRQSSSEGLQERAKKREQASLSLREQIKRDKEAAAKAKRENGGQMPASPVNKVVTKDGDLTETNYD